MEKELKEKELKEKLDKAIWVARSLFERSRTTGSSANLSFLHGKTMYITISGSCFGTLDAEQFAAVDLDGNNLGSKRPSKEWPLHLAVYQQKPWTGAVIHTHGAGAVLWSFVPPEDEEDCIPACTPYLRMKLGKVCCGLLAGHNNWRTNAGLRNGKGFLEETLLVQSSIK